MTWMSHPNDLGELLRARRKARRVSWKRLEEAVQVEARTMQLWETGVTVDPPLRKVLLFAREVGITPEELAAAARATPRVAGIDPVVAGSQSDLAAADAAGLPTDSEAQPVAVKAAQKRRRSA